MTPLQWAIVDDLEARAASSAKMIARSLEPQFPDINVLRVSSSLGILRSKGVVKREKRPTGNWLTIRGERVRQFMTVWSLRADAVLPARQETLF